MHKMQKHAGAFIKLLYGFVHVRAIIYSQKLYRLQTCLSIQCVHGDLCKHLGIESRSVLESIPKCLHKSPCACRILKNDLIL